MTKITKIFFSLLITLAVFIWVAVVRSPSGTGCNIYFFDVGQGDAALIEKGNFQILIDGGPDDKILSEIGKAMPLTDRKIEVVILTHPHADHLVGINQILDRYEVGKIYSTGVIHTTNAYLEFLDKINPPAGGKNISLEVPDVAEEITPFDNGKLRFLWPGKRDVGKSAEDNNLNNTSLVSRFCYFDHCVLLPGDLETDGQEEMFSYYSSKQSEVPAEKSANNNSQPSASNNNIFQSEILKVAHHGSVNGTNQKLLDIVKPKFAVISVGADNKFGHPHAGTLDLLQKANIQYYRTDRDGTVEFNLSEQGIVKE
ncbi:MAG: MBL fold metallo-hydrolase [Patescibacteria group bacterium]|nr:MBL fold metallo-hydrolase [Patescibacteria group bacterium]